MFTQDELKELQEATVPEFFRILYEKTGDGCFFDNAKLYAYTADLLSAPTNFKQRLRYAVMLNVHQLILREPCCGLDDSRMMQIVQIVEEQTGMCHEAAEEIVCIFAYATGRRVTCAISETYYSTLRPVKIAGKYGYANEENNLVIPAVYDRAKPFLQDRSKVCKNQKYGFIDRSGKQVIALIYDSAEDFTGPTTEVIYNGERLVIDVYGNKIY